MHPDNVVLVHLKIHQECIGAAHRGQSPLRVGQLAALDEHVVHAAIDEAAHRVVALGGTAQGQPVLGQAKLVAQARARLDVGLLRGEPCIARRGISQLAAIEFSAAANLLFPKGLLPGELQAIVGEPGAGLLHS